MLRDELLQRLGSARTRRVVLIQDLGRRGLTSLFLEGGPTLASAFLAADQIDASETFIAPILLGQPKPPLAVGDPEGVCEDVNLARSTPPRGQAPPRRSALESSQQTIGDDVLVTARFREW